MSGDKRPKVTRIDPAEPGPPGGIVKVSLDELRELFPEPNPYDDHLHQCALMASTVRALVKAAREVLAAEDPEAWDCTHPPELMKALRAALKPFEGP